jgi:hypothetical protein
MNPLLMGLIILGLVSFFALSAKRRMALLRVGMPTDEPRFDGLGDRLAQVWTFALWQKKMRYYFVAGVAHQLIFVGFVVLLLRTLVLWGRGFSPDFNLWVLGFDSPLGPPYAFLKDVFAL